MVSSHFLNLWASVPKVSVGNTFLQRGFVLVWNPDPCKVWYRPGNPFKNPRLNLAVPISAPHSLQVAPFGVANKCIYPQVYITFGFQLLVTMFSSFEYFPIILQAQKCVQKCVL